MKLKIIVSFAIGAWVMLVVCCGFHEYFWPPPDVAEVTFYATPTPEQIENATLAVSGQQTGSASGKVSYQEIIKYWQTPPLNSDESANIPDTPEDDGEETVKETPDKEHIADPGKMFLELAPGKTVEIPVEGSVKTVWTDDKTGERLGESEKKLTGFTEITFGEDEIFARLNVINTLNFVVDFIPEKPKRKYFRAGAGRSFSVYEGEPSYTVLHLEWFRPLKLPLLGESWGPFVRPEVGRGGRWVVGLQQEF